MRNKFDEDLDNLNKQMMKMGSMIEDAIRKAIDALVNHNEEMARAVYEGDEDVDKQQKLIENICFNLLIQRQPVARDLRTITAAMKMVTDMERIGDQAADISEITIHLAHEKYIKKLEHIDKMASETMIMLIQSIEAYVEKDMEKAHKVIEHDDLVDALFEQVRDDLVEMIHKDAACGEQAAELLMVAKYFERIGDHATNIAEWVIFSLDNKMPVSPEA